LKIGHNHVKLCLQNMILKKAALLVFVLGKLLEQKIFYIEKKKHGLKLFFFRVFV